MHHLLDISFSNVCQILSDLLSVDSPVKVKYLISNRLRDVISCFMLAELDEEPSLRSLQLLWAYCLRILFNYFIGGLDAVFEVIRFY